MSRDQHAPTPPPGQQPQPATGGRTRWVLGAAAAAVVCCAGPGLLAALGVGALGTVAGVALGVGALTVAAATVLIGALLLFRWRG